MDDLISEMALTWVDGGGDQLGFLCYADRICEKIAEVVESREDEQIRRDMEAAERAAVERENYYDMQREEERLMETDWVKLSESF